MRKKIGTLLIVGSLGALCIGLCACNDDTELDNQFKSGNVITVRYDASGGEILHSPDRLLIDMFNPSKYTADENGYVHIKLREPTDPSRPTSNGDPIPVTKGAEALVGWYRGRESVTDAEGNVSYTYFDPWDFASDTVDFKVGDEGDEKLDITLYAAWLEPYSFEYYYKATPEDTEWTLFNTKTFNYITALEEDDSADSDSARLDTIYIPKWSLGETGSGRMDHNRVSGFSFPSVEGKTFKAAYSDEACTQEITDSFQHKGELDFATATPKNPVQKIYVEFEEGNRYKISTAAQFASIADPEGIYTILSDELDFKCELSEEGGLNFPQGSVRWPMRLMTETFTGQIAGEDGKAVTFKNVGARYNVTSNATQGGLFGSIGSDAKIEKVTFENAVVDFQAATSSRESNFGMLAGTVEDGATLDITIGGEMHLGQISINKERRSFNLIANGDYEGVTKGDIVLKVYGTARSNGKYRFEVDPETCTLDENGNILFENTPDYPLSDKEREKQFYVIEYQNQTENGGQNNE